MAAKKHVQRIKKESETEKEKRQTKRPCSAIENRKKERNEKTKERDFLIEK